MQRWGFYFKSEFWKVHFKFTHSGSHSAKCTGAIFSSSSLCAASSGLFCREKIVGFFGLSVIRVVLFVLFFFWVTMHSSWSVMLTRDDGETLTGRMILRVMLVLMGGEWRESGSAITGSAAGPFTGGKKDDPGLGRGHLLFSHLGWFTTDLGWLMKPRSVLLCNPFLPLETEGWGKYLSSHAFYTT